MSWYAVKINQSTIFLNMFLMDEGSHCVIFDKKIWLDFFIIQLKYV